MNSFDSETISNYNYMEVSLFAEPFSEDATDILAALLASIDFDCFSTEGNCLKAYCSTKKFSVEALNKTLSDFPLSGVMVTWRAVEVETQDWNSEWEESVNFEPILIDNQCCIHSPNVIELPHCKYNILIAPRMSFGSGHHETTRMLLREIMDVFCDSSDIPTKKIRSVLDMGTGTGILAILCGMLGAEVRAVEIDRWVADNALDNVLLNNLAGRVKVECGDVSVLQNGETYDLVLANINRNVLLADMHAYVANLNPFGILLMSGFYEDDLPQILECADSLGMSFVSHKKDDNWVVAKFIKNVCI